MEPHALLEAQPGTTHPWVLQTGSQPSRGCSSPRGTRRARSPAPSPSEGSCSPSFPLPSSPSELQPHRNTRLRSINSRVACQVHSLTSRIAHAKPQVFYETFPVMKTFLWGFFFSFPSSSPLLLLLLLPGGWCPSQKKTKGRCGVSQAPGRVVRSVMPARGVPASCHAAPARTAWGGGSCSTQPPARCCRDCAGSTGTSTAVSSWVPHRRRISNPLGVLQRNPPSPAIPMAGNLQARGHEPQS